MPADIPTTDTTIAGIDNNFAILLPSTNAQEAAGLAEQQGGAGAVVLLRPTTAKSPPMM